MLFFKDQSVYDANFDISIGYAETFLWFTYYTNDVSHFPLWFPMREGIAILCLCLASPLWFPAAVLAEAWPGTRCRWGWELPSSPAACPWPSVGPPNRSGDPQRWMQRRWRRLQQQRGSTTDKALSFWPPLDYIKKKWERPPFILIRAEIIWNGNISISPPLKKWICLIKRMLSTIIFENIQGSFSMCCNEIPKLQWPNEKSTKSFGMHVKLFQENHRRCF